MDCPGITEGAYSDYVYLYQFAGATTGTCDPLQTPPATVVCGTLSGPGMISRTQQLINMDCWAALQASFHPGVCNSHVHL